MVGGFYIECVRCGVARFTDNRDSVSDFGVVHAKDTGHRDFYQGPMPAERAARLKNVDAIRALVERTSQGGTDV